jgi:hypothetical protein
MGLNSAKRPRSRCKMNPLPELSTALVAWYVEIHTMRCVVFAATAPKARWIAVKSYWEAGYGQKGMWPRPHAWRAPHFDKSRLAKENPRVAYGEEYVHGT